QCQAEPGAVVTPPRDQLAVLVIEEEEPLQLLTRRRSPEPPHTARPAGHSGNLPRHRTRDINIRKHIHDHRSWALTSVYTATAVFYKITRRGPKPHRDQCRWFPPTR